MAADCTELYPAEYGCCASCRCRHRINLCGWGGDPDCSDGKVTLDAAKTCSATFTINSYTITEAVVGGNGYYHLYIARDSWQQQCLYDFSSIWLYAGDINRRGG